MKKIKKDKSRKNFDNAVETPPPPQVMDPSSLPQRTDDEKDGGNKGGYSFEREKTPQREQLAPREEL